MLPSALNAIVNPKHHSVGISTARITLLSNILSISFLAFSLKPIGIDLGVKILNGTVSGFKTILKTSGMVPNPWNKSLNNLNGSKTDKLHDIEFTTWSKCKP